MILYRHHLQWCICVLTDLFGLLTADFAVFSLAILVLYPSYEVWDWEGYKIFITVLFVFSSFVRSRFSPRYFTNRREIRYELWLIFEGGLLKFWGRYPAGRGEIVRLNVTPGRLFGEGGCRMEGICVLLTHLFNVDLLSL